MKQDFAVLITPHQADWQTAAQFPSRSLVADAAIEARPNDMQFCFTHGALKPEHQTVVEKRRVIKSIAIADQRVSQAAEIEQPIPIGIIAGEAGDFEPQDNTNSSESDFGGEASEAGALGDTGAGKTEVFI